MASIGEPAQLIGYLAALLVGNHCSLLFHTSTATLLHLSSEPGNLYPPTIGPLAPQLQHLTK